MTNRRSTARRMLALNGALLTAVAAVALVPQADAQNRRARGDYAMVSGRMQIANRSTVYLLDTANQEMVALRWDLSQKRFETLGHRRLNEDVDRAKGGGR